MQSLSFLLGLFLHRKVYGLNKNISHHPAWGGVVGHKVPHPGFSKSLRNESRGFCYSLTEGFERKKVEREQMFWVHLTRLIFESGVKPDGPTAERAGMTEQLDLKLPPQELTNWVFPFIHFWSGRSNRMWDPTTERESALCLKSGVPLKKTRRSPMPGYGILLV